MTKNQDKERQALAGSRPRALVYGDVDNDFRVPGFIAWGDRAGLLAAACK